MAVDVRKLSRPYQDPLELVTILRRRSGSHVAQCSSGPVPGKATARPKAYGHGCMGGHMQQVVGAARIHGGAVQ